MYRGGATIQIAEAGWVNSAWLPVGDLAVSWVVNEAGTLTATVNVEDLLAHWDRELLNAWVRWEDGDAGPWEGVIRVEDGSVEEGTKTITARSFYSLLDGLRSPFQRLPVTLAPGGIMARLLSVGSYAGVVWLDSWQVAAGGDPIDWEFRGGNLYDEVQALVSQSGWQCLVDEDRVLTFAPRVGSYKSGVWLWEGKQIVGGTPTRTIDGLVNDVMVVNRVERSRLQRELIAVNPSSRSTWGPRQATIDVGPEVVFSALRGRATREAFAQPDPPGVVRLSVARVGGAWSGWREGDTIGATLAAGNRQTRFQVLSRSLTAGDDVMEVAGIEEDWT